MSFEMQDPDTPLEKLLSELKAAETRVWQALVDGDADADAAALDDAFLGVYPSGFATREEHIDQLKHGPTVAQFTLSELRIRRLGPEHAVLSYCANFQRVGRSMSERMYVSSIWKRCVDGWINILSQDTPADIH